MHSAPQRLTKDVHVLVVDDDAGIREMLRFMLEDAGWTVEEAADGLAALAILRASSQQFVVLLDYVMPGPDGREVLEEIAADLALARRHAYLVVTASARIHLLEGELQQLATLLVPVLRKPFDVDVILTAIEDAARRLQAAS